MLYKESNYVIVTGSSVIGVGMNVLAGKLMFYKIPNNLGLPE
jgi:hypothetical protein